MWSKLYFASRKEIGSTRRRTSWTACSSRQARCCGSVQSHWWLVRPNSRSHCCTRWPSSCRFPAVERRHRLRGLLQHTSPGIRSLRNRHEWQRNKAYLTATAACAFRRIDRLMHGMVSNAHHVNPGIPMSRLRAAQRVLQQKFPELCDYRLDWRSVRAQCAQLQALVYRHHVAGLRRQGLHGARPDGDRGH